jgi:hypothetical protein
MSAIIEETKEQKKEQRRKEKELKLKQEITEATDFLDNELFYFYYEKLDKRAPTRDYRLNLQKMYCYMYYKKKIVDIPKITKLKIKFGSEYNVIFENREDFVETEIELKKKVDIEPIVFDKSKFRWMKNIENQEHGIIDND